MFSLDGDPLVSPDPPRDRFEFWVRFVFGACFGVVVGLWVWLRAFAVAPLGWVALPVCAVLIGVVAGRYGDSFWHSLRDWWYF